MELDLATPCFILHAKLICFLITKLEYTSDTTNAMLRIHKSVSVCYQWFTELNE